MRRLSPLLLLVIGLGGFALGAFGPGAPAPASPTPARAADTGVIKGRVINGTTDRAQEGLKVRLARIDAETQEVERNYATTDERGRYVFNDLPTGDGYSYAIGARYDGGLFAGPPITIPDDTSETPVIATTLRVWDTITDPAVIAIERDAIFMIQRGSTLAIVESVRVVNQTDHAYIGRGGEEKAAASLGFALPAGADRSRLVIQDSDLPVLGPTETTYGFAATIAIPPGVTQTTFTYPVEGGGGSFDISRTALYPIREFVVHASDPLRVESNRLTRDGDVTVEGQHYERWMAELPLEAGDQIQMVAIADAGSGISTALGIAVVVGAIAAGFVILVLRRTRRRAPAPTRDDLLISIAELDARHDAGDIPHDEWAAQRSQIKERVKELAR